MIFMRNPTGGEKIQAQSIPEIGDFLDAEYKRLARLENRVEFRGRSVSAGTLLNAIVLYFASFDPRDREAVAREFLARYEAILEHDDVQSIDGTENPALGPLRGQGFPVGIGAIDVPAPKRKSKREDSTSALADCPFRRLREF